MLSFSHNVFKKHWLNDFVHSLKTLLCLLQMHRRAQREISFCQTDNVILSELQQNYRLIALDSSFKRHNKIGRSYGFVCQTLEMWGGKRRKCWLSEFSSSTMFSKACFKRK